MKKLLVLLNFFILCFSVTYSQTGWFIQSTPLTNHLMDVFFINAQTGWICGDSGKILKTTNGGTNWLLKNTPSTYTLRAIRFTDLNYGYSVGGVNPGNPFCMDNNVILKTTNGGENWYIIPGACDPGDIYYDVAVLNKDTVFVTYAGTDNTCYNNSGGSFRSFNTGSNWTQFVGGHMKGVSFINSNTGWLSSYGGGGSPLSGYYTLYKTTNTGLNWTIIYQDTGVTNTGKIKFIDAATGFISRGMLRKTTNSGNNWQKIDSVTTFNLRSFYPVNKDTLWIIRSSGSVLRTNNSGTNWTQQLTPGVSLNSVYFFDKNTGWIAGNSGIIYKTITGGVTGISPVSREVPSEYSLGQNYPNPFNPMTRIRFDLSRTENGKQKTVTKLVVYDITGKEILVLVNEELQPGSYEVTFDGSNLNSGIYFYQMVSGDFKQTRKLILLK
jgi:photosystem II stability/assembly factor-like uncharacterized protein